MTVLDDHRNPDGTYDGIGAMSDLTGMSRDRLKQLAEAVRANHAALSSCAYHEFEPMAPIQPPALSITQKYRCQHCGGEVESFAYRWHEQGRRARPGG